MFHAVLPRVRAATAVFSLLHVFNCHSYYEMVCFLYTVHNGQTKKCCDGIRICFVHLADSFTVVRLQAIGNQDMHHACRYVLEAHREDFVLFSSDLHTLNHQDIFICDLLFLSMYLYFSYLVLRLCPVLDLSLLLHFLLCGL